MSVRNKANAAGATVVPIRTADPLLEGYIPDRPELDPKALHGLPGKIINEVRPLTEADPAAILLQLLTWFGCAIGRYAYIYAGAQRHYSNLFGIVVGPTSQGRKGTSDAIVKTIFNSSSVLKDFFNLAFISGLSTGEGLIGEVKDTRQEEIEDPKNGGMKTRTIPGVVDKRRLIIETEFSRILKMMTRDGNVLPETLMQAWDTGYLRTIAKSNADRATDAHISLIGHITPSSFQRRLTAEDTSNGFINRYIVVFSRMSQTIPRSKPIKFDQRTISDLENAIQFAQFSQKEVQLDLDSGSENLWKSIYPDLTKRPSNTYGEITSRAAAQVLRLSLVYALFDKSTTITHPHLEAALALWRYSEASVKFIFGSRSSDQIADETLQIIEKSGNQGITRTEISKAIGRKANGESIKNALDALYRDGQIIRKEIQTAGRPIERWFKAP
jgi:uncharacterized protein DUF3987